MAATHSRPRHLRESSPALNIYLDHAMSQGWQQVTDHWDLPWFLPCISLSLFWLSSPNRHPTLRNYFLIICSSIYMFSLRYSVYILFALLLLYQARGLGKTERRVSPKYIWPDWRFWEDQKTSQSLIHLARVEVLGRPKDGSVLYTWPD